MNNGYPQAMLEKVIHSKTNKHFFRAKEGDSNKITFFVQFYSVSRFKDDMCRTNAAVTSHVRAWAPITKVVITPNNKLYKIVCILYWF